MDEVEIELECRHESDVPSTNVHAVTLRPDGTVTTPHDIDAERVANAFGGYNSCVELVDATAPAIAQVWGLISRRWRPEITRVTNGRWLSMRAKAKGRQCDCFLASGSPTLAARHALTPSHLVSRFPVAVPDWQFFDVVRQLSDHFARIEGVERGDPGLERRIEGNNSVRYLWAAGLRPQWIREILSAMPRMDQALPVDFFVHLAHSETDTEWFTRALRGVTNPVTATWLVQQARPDVLVPPEEWADWLGVGVSRRDLEDAVRYGLDLADVHAIAKEHSWNPSAATRRLLQWHRVGASLTPAHMRILVHHGLADQCPSKASIADLANRWEIPQDPRQRTEVALILTLAGTRADATQALSEGIRTAYEYSNHRATGARP